MQPILLYYLAGLTVALSVGFVCYYTIGFAATPLLEALFGRASGRLWGRLFRMSVVTVALVGGLSLKFYGCNGPTDYKDIEHDHQQMFARTSEQVASSLDYSRQYVLLAAGIGALACAVLRIKRRA